MDPDTVPTRRQAEDLRPPKRVRMSHPDEVDSSATNSRTSKTVNAPKFVSGFGEASVSPSRLESRRAVTRRLDPSKPAALLKSVAVAAEKASTSTNLRVRKPPIYIFPTGAGETTSSTREAPKLPKRRSVVTVPQEPSSDHIMSKPKFKLPTALPRPKAVNPISRIAHPAVAGPSRQKDPEMKTLSTTRVALATDPRSESGAAELLSIILHQQGDVFVDPIQREMQRGLLQSPEKASKAKNPKYIRGGLADRASYHLKHTQNALSLWYKDLELQLSSSRRPPPDMRLRITSIIRAPADTQGSNIPSRTSFLHCHTLSRSVPRKDVVLLLDFDHVVSALTQTTTMKDVQEGREVHIWKPWYTLDVASPTKPVIPVDPLSESMDDDRSDRQEKDHSTEMLLCSRFWIFPA